MIKKLIAASVLSILVIFVLTSGCIFGDTYYVGIDTDGTSPFIIQNENGEFSGFDVESMEWIAYYENMNIEFVECEWENIIPSLESGKVDLIYSDLSVTEEREERIAFSKPYLSINIAVASNKKYNLTMDDFFNGKTIMGYPKDTSSEKYIKEQFKDSYDRLTNEDKIIPYEYVEDMLYALDSGVIQTAVYEDNYFREHITENMTVLGNTGISDDIAVGVRKENTILLDKINDGLTALMASDKWTELKNKYGID